MNATLENVEALILSGEGYSLEVAPSVIEQKADLLQFSALITTVTDPVSSDAASHQIKKLAAMRNLVEKSRTTVKSPVIATGKRIDSLAADFQADITAEETRLKKLQGDYAMEVEKERRRVIAEMEKARQQEAERIRLAEAAAAMAERERIAAEAAAFAATTPEEDAAAESAAKAVEAAQAKLAADEAARVAALPVVVPSFVPEAPKGVKFEWDYVVTDPVALFMHNNGLVDLVPKRSTILERIKGMAVGDDTPVIPGLIISKVAKVSAR
jgi:murein DD-endopeptidase MepM/ murein hydrolase activator NlpD